MLYNEMASPVPTVKKSFLSLLSVVELIAQGISLII
jgi:hypothetical protein